MPDPIHQNFDIIPVKLPAYYLKYPELYQKRELSRKIALANNKKIFANKPGFDIWFNFPAQRAIQNLHLNIASNQAIIDEFNTKPSFAFNKFINSSYLSFNYYDNNTPITNINLSLFGTPDSRKIHNNSIIHPPGTNSSEMYTITSQNKLNQSFQINYILFKYDNSQCDSY